MQKYEFRKILHLFSPLAFDYCFVPFHVHFKFLVVKKKINTSLVVEH